MDRQARAENLSRIIVVLFGVVGLVWGYIIQQFSQTVYILGAGLVLATIVSTPTKIIREVIVIKIAILFITFFH